MVGGNGFEPLIPACKAVQTGSLGNALPCKHLQPETLPVWRSCTITRGNADNHGPWATVWATLTLMILQYAGNAGQSDSWPDNHSIAKGSILEHLLWAL